MALKRTQDGAVIGCGVLIINPQRQILLLRRGATAPTCPGMWGGPGGLQEDDETESEAATREVREEAGIEITLDSGTPFFSSRWSGDGREIRYFLAHVDGNVTITFPDKEADAYVWASYEEAMRLPLAFCYKEALEKLHEEELL